LEHIALALLPSRGTGCIQIAEKASKIACNHVGAVRLTLIRKKEASKQKKKDFTFSGDH